VNGQQEYQQVNSATPTARIKTGQSRSASRWRRTWNKAYFTHSNVVVIAVATAAIAVFVISGFVWKEWNKRSWHESSAQTLVAAAPGFTSGKILRVMMGNHSAPYIDRGGFSWGDDHSAPEGTHSLSRAALFKARRTRGFLPAGDVAPFIVISPVPPGTYEVHLLFAETSGLQEASRNVAFSINGGPLTNLDVVDDAGGVDIATTKVFTDVTPASDGNNPSGLQYRGGIRKCG